MVEVNTHTKRMLRVFLPQLVIVALLIVYVISGAYVYTLIDPKLANENFTDLILFTFSTITTIGYGNISPSTETAQLFTIAFGTLGIPLALLTLANMGKYLTKSYWMILVCLGKNIPRRPTGDAKLPLKTIIFLFFVTFIFGAVLFHHTGRKITMDDVYFSVISFATVGFGDKFPKAGSPMRLISMIVYLTWGMILTATLFSVLSAYLRKVHYLGRRFRGARDVHVWFGGKSMKVSQLLEVVAKEFNASHRQVGRVLHDLDNLITAAIAENEAKAKLNAHIHMQLPHETHSPFAKIKNPLSMFNNQPRSDIEEEEVEL